MDTGFVGAGALALRRGTTRKTNVSVRPAVAARRIRGARMGAPVEVTEDTFAAQVLESELPVLIYFGAPWCGPCKLTSPLMEWAASEYDGRIKVAKVDTDKTDPKIVDFPIHGLPTLAVFKKGNASAVQEGAVGKKGLAEYIEKNVMCD